MNVKNEKQVKIYLLTGFLGSGKTTLLLKFLKELYGKKVGVIVNEFGQVGIDGEIIRRSGLDMVEINNGQIFCSCKKGDFIQTTVKFLGMDFEYILIEASGLALPGTLKTTFKEIQKLSNKYIDYRGTVCVTGTQQFFDLIDVVIAFEEQIVHSDVVLINKIDLADEKLLNNIECEIRRLNKSARIIRTLYCDTVAEILKESGVFKPGESRLNELKTVLQLSDGKCESLPEARIRKYFLVPMGIMERSSLEEFLESITPHVYRIKGFIEADQGLLYIDIIKGEHISVRKTNNNVEKYKYGIIIISISNINIKEKIMKAWRVNIPFPCLIS